MKHDITDRNIYNGLGFINGLFPLTRSGTDKNRGKSVLIVKM